MGWARRTADVVVRPVGGKSGEAALARVLATLGRVTGAGWQGSRRPFDHAAQMKPSNQQQPRRIAVLVKRFPRLSETFILNELLELRRQGMPLDLYAIMDPHEHRAHPEALALVPEVVYLRSGSIWSSLPSALRTMRRHPRGAFRAAAWVLTRHNVALVRDCVYAMVLVDRLRHREPAHLHAHFLHSPAVIAFIASKISQQRYSLTGHAKDIYATPPENVLMYCRDAKFVTTCTDANRRHLVEEIGLSPSKVWLCRHGVDADRFSAERSDPKAGRILSVGRLVPKKGFDVLVRACGQMRRSGVDFELRIVGSGPMRDELLALAEHEGIADLVHLPGSMSQAELAVQLAAAEVFALSPMVMPDGDRDGIPNVVLEAMASGVPVVASAVSGIPEVINDGVNGRLVPPRRPDLLADTLAELLSDGTQRARLAAAAERFVGEECSWARVVLPLRELLSGALAPAVEPIAVEPIGHAVRVGAG
jgi:glycosyltransferase involved in cell wall biosynthesis